MAADEVSSVKPTTLTLDDLLAEKIQREQQQSKVTQPLRK